MNKDYIVTIKVDIHDCKDKQEAITFVEDRIGLSEFNLEITAEEGA
jgi:hypothetical protein